MKKRICCTLLATLMIISLFSTANATGEDGYFTTETKAEIVNIVENFDPDNSEQMFVNLLDDGSRNSVASFSLDDIDIVDYDVTYVDAVAEEIVQIDHNTTVEFLTSGDFLVYFGTDEGNPTSRASTQTLTSSVYAYNALGYNIWTAYANGYFTLNGSRGTPDPVLTYATYEKYGALNVWTVSNWQKGTAKYTNEKKARFYASGNFSWGLQIQGQGLVIQNKAVYVGYECNSSGTTTNLKSMK